MPSGLEAWRRARANLAHDWLERRLLPVLNTSASESELKTRASLCLDAWFQEVKPRLEEALQPLPECLLPSELVSRWLDHPERQIVDSAALATDIVPGIALGSVAAEIRKRALEAQSALVYYLSDPQEKQRQIAFDSVMQVRLLLQQMPRSVLLP